MRTRAVKLTGPDTPDSVRPGTSNLPPPPIQIAASRRKNAEADSTRGAARAVGGDCSRRTPSNRRFRAGSRAGFPIGLLIALLVLSQGCAEKQPTFEEIKPADELYAEGLEILEGRRILGLFNYVNYDQAIETFQSIIDNYPYSEFEEKALLKIADAYFADHRYEEALAYYQDFVDLHPRHENVPYALLRIAQCHFNQIESIDRDQTETRRATEALETLIRRFPYAPETREGERMMIELRTRLALNMIHIADFYLDRTHWQSAAVRYRRVLDEYPGLGLDARALYRLGLCMENMHREDEALRLYHVVVENYADSPAAKRARARIARAD
ncbi:MAG TPA: outer membrane protein assembly factor BamD [Deltaproteobacteria bacterium]|nr:outer membrane protein assembly factor BamD [Deltaproteobacteria bacterium]